MNTSIKIGSLKLRNPVMNASGTFGMEEYKKYIDFSRIGALVPKSVTLNSRTGNKPPRITEVEGGILNCVGIENKGVIDFIQNKIPKIKSIDTNIIVSVANNSIDEYKTSVEILEKSTGISAYELNISCPNIAEEGKAFGMSADATYKVVKSVRDISTKPIIVKLTPNVTDIIEIAEAAVKAGADALTVANTYIGMAVDLESRKAILGNTIGGFSGASIKPLTLRLVYSIKKKLDIPVIGCGGIFTAEDALEYLLVGACAVQVGTANFTKPDIMEDIVSGIENFMIEKNIEDINDFIGTIK
ncbi:dihydroorotate dehydrogenase [Clostridium sp.]|jgi:dihydroorotate dehydrogenase (NAD+) catalytic subunit|uniref:dihydroorotate dehydrogenase n=1 Tax=Clostridium sp. TaxID=1506 RepID=UPI003A5C4FCC